MTREELLAKAELLEGEIRTSVEEYNDAYQNARYDEAAVIEDKITEKVNEHTSIKKTICFDECRETPDPMLEACKRLSYQILSIKDTKEGDKKIPVRIVEETFRGINLLKLHKFVKDGIGADKSWSNAVEKLNLLMTLQTAKDLKVCVEDIDNSYAMNRLSREYSFDKLKAKNVNEVLKMLTTIVHAMLGENYTPEECDAHYIIKTYARKTRGALKVKVATHKALVGVIQEVCHRIITGKTYEVDYKRIKDAK